MNDFWQQFTFYALAALVLGSALMVVSLRNIVHCALFLMMAFIGVAGIFLTLYADFIAGVQVLIYVGAITVLILFALMLTQKIVGFQVKQTNKLSPLAMIAGVGFFLLTAVLASEARFPLLTGTKGADSTDEIARALLGTGDYVLPFEVASLLLLVAMIGAILIARERDQ